MVSQGKPLEGQAGHRLRRGQILWSPALPLTHLAL